MLKRGLKRKWQTEITDPSVPDDYQKGLSDFQTAARKRESMRLKAQATVRQPLSAPDGNWESTIKDKIDMEQKVLDGAEKLLKMAGKNEHQSLEASKSLLLSKLRVGMLKYELNKFRRGRASPQLKQQQGRPSYGGVCLSDVRIPFVWRLDQEDIKRAHTFAIFCVARIGSQIYDTSLVHPVDDRTCADVSFTDTIEFNRVGPHFEMILEIYARPLDFEPEPPETNLLLETPSKIARSISKAVGKKLQRSKKDDSTTFEMVASVTLSLDNCSEGIETHELYVDEPNAPTCPSFFGHACCRLVAMPYCSEQEVIEGPVGLNKSDKIHQMWSRLMDWKLSLWNEISQKEQARRPIVEIPVTRDTCILEQGELAITLTNNADRESVTWKLTFDDEEQKETFLVHLFQHAADHRRWKKAALSKMALHSGPVVKSTSSLGKDSVPLYESIITKKRRNTLKRSATVKRAKSFKRTKSKLALIYNQTGLDDENVSRTANQKLI